MFVRFDKNNNKHKYSQSSFKCVLSIVRVGSARVNVFDVNYFEVINVARTIDARLSLSIIIITIKVINKISNQSQHRSTWVSIWTRDQVKRIHDTKREESDWRENPLGVRSKRHWQIDFDLSQSACSAWLCEILLKTPSLVESNSRHV